MKINKYINISRSEAAAVLYYFIQRCINNCGCFAVSTNKWTQGENIKNH